MEIILVWEAKYDKLIATARTIEYGKWKQRNELQWKLDLTNLYIAKPSI